MEELVNRVKSIIDLCWNSFSAKVGGGLISINKEASMQLQFAYILKNALDLSVFNIDESVELELETDILVKGRLRECDIVIQMSKGEQLFYLPIEMKCYKEYSSSGGKRGASDVFMKDVHLDLELVEHYGMNDNYIEGMVLVMTNLRRLAYPKTKNGKKWDYDISNGVTISGPIDFNTPIGGYEVNIKLKGNYNFNWERVNDYYFLKLVNNTLRHVITQ